MRAARGSLGHLVPGRRDEHSSAPPSRLARPYSLPLPTTAALKHSHMPCSPVTAPGTGDTVLSVTQARTHAPMRQGRGLGVLALSAQLTPALLWPWEGHSEAQFTQL